MSNRLLCALPYNWQIGITLSIGPVLDKLPRLKFFKFICGM